MQKIRFFLIFLKYKLFAKYKKGFGIHSPFLFNLAEDVFFDKNPYYAFDDIWELRQDLLEDETEIEVSAGSKIMKSNIRKVRQIAKYSALSEKFGELYFKLVNKFKPATILEIGTSIGLGTLYLAMPNSKSKVYTMEGCPETANIAKQNFDFMEVENIEQIIGNFDKVLPNFLSKIEKLDFVYFDGNHRKEPTLQYFEMCLSKVHNNTVFIFDDIHWSKGMEDAWTQVKENKKVTLSIDLFYSGIVFFKKELTKQNFVVKF